MRLLMLNHNVAARGGTFFRAYQFARHMVRRGHEVNLLAISPTKRIGFRESVGDGVHLVETPDLFWGRGRSGWDPWGVLQRMLFVRRKPYDLVHAFDSRPAVILPALALKRRGVPLVMDWADWWGRGGTNSERPGRVVNTLIAPIETFFEERFRPRADGNTVISRALYERALSLGVRSEALVHLGQGSDVERVMPLDRVRARQALGLPADAPIVGHLGVLQPRDADLLFAAFSRISPELPACRLALIGQHRCDLGRFRLNSNLIETGFLSHEKLLQHLAACDVFVLPLADTLANRARWPSRVNDYLAAGRPVISTAVGDVASLIRDNGVGRVARPETDDLAAAIIDMLGDRPLREECGRKARSLAETRLAWPIVTEELERFYRRIV